MHPSPSLQTGLKLVVHLGILNLTSFFFLYMIYLKVFSSCESVGIRRSDRKPDDVQIRGFRFNHHCSSLKEGCSRSGDSLHLGLVPVAAANRTVRIDLIMAV